MIADVKVVTKNVKTNASFKNEQRCIILDNYNSIIWLYLCTAFAKMEIFEDYVNLVTNLDER